MDVDTQQVSVFKILLNKESSISPHQIYTACKPFGVIVGFNNTSRKECIKFIRSIHTDRLKPVHILRIGNEEFDLQWLRDDLPIGPLQQMPELESNQQSPQNILDVVNDDCLREIFVNLPELDWCAVAHVCQRFRDVVLAIKPKHIEIINDSCTDPLWKFEKFLRIFGKSIQTAYITDCCRCPDIVLVFLSRYCENLVEVDCADYVKSTTMNELAALFPRLRRVRLWHHGTADIVFQPNDRIESIRVEKVSHLPPLHFPKLRELQLDIEKAHEPSIEPFFALNQQIETLEFDDDDSVHFSMSIILKNLPRLQKFRIDWFDLYDDDSIRKLCQAKHLYTLQLTFSDGDVVHMLRGFVENGIQLKSFKIWSNLVDYTYDVDLLIRIKSLKYLEMDYLSDDQLVRVVGNLPSLKTIEIESDKLTPRGVRDALRCANNLENAKFFMRVYDDQGINRIVDQSNVIDEIGELREKKQVNIQVKIYIGDDRDNSGEVIRDMWDRHSEWFSEKLE